MATPLWRQTKPAFFTENGRQAFARAFRRWRDMPLLARKDWEVLFDEFEKELLIANKRPMTEVK